MSASRSEVLRGVVEHVHERLFEPNRVGLQPQRLIRYREAEPPVVGIRELCADLCRLFDDGAEIHRRRLQVELPSGEPRHLEEIVDDACEMPHLPPDGRAHGGLLRIVGRELCLYAHCRRDGVQRIAQLVCEHRQKFVNPAVGDGSDAPPEGSRTELMSGVRT